MKIGERACLLYAEHQVQGRLLLDVVVGEGAAVLELLAREDETLLVGGDALLVLDLRLDVVNRVRGLNLQGDGLACEGLDEDLHVCLGTVRASFACVGLWVLLDCKTSASGLDE